MDSPTAHPLYYPDDWRDPIINQPVRKQREGESRREFLIEHYKWRLGIRDACNGKRARSVRAQFIEWCRYSPIFFVNAFGWTYLQIETDEEGKRKAAGGIKRVPFVTWPMQDALLLRIRRAVHEGTNLAVDKSREVGATWVELFDDIHRWLFERDTSVLLVSRKQDAVDAPGDPNSLFWKLDFGIAMLPDWMRPSEKRGNHPARSFMKWQNFESGSVITGESSNANIGRSGRMTKITFDEAAANPEFEAGLMSAADATGTIVAISTPAGPGAFQRFRFGGTPVFIAGYWDAPDKGRGRELRTDPEFGRYWWSPFFQAERDKPRTVQDLAQNLLCNHSAAGSMVMDSMHLARQHASYVLPAVVTVLDRGFRAADIDIIAQPGTRDVLIAQAIERADTAHIAFRPSRAGRWRFWLPLDEDTGRPAQDRNYAFAGDLSWGRGASNSPFCVFDSNTGEQVAEFCDSRSDPKEVARLMAIAAVWFGGESEPLIGWEANGPGNEFGDELIGLGYGSLYRHRPSGKTRKAEAAHYGWVSNRQSLIDACANLRDGMATDEIRFRSERVIADLGKLVWTPTGGIEHGDLQGDETGAKATHADFATAALVGLMVIRRAPELALPRRKIGLFSPAHAEYEPVEDDVDDSSMRW